MNTTTALTGAQRRQLRGLAHHLSPVVQVGQNGVTDELMNAVDHALERHELIKVRIQEGAPVDRKDAGPLLAQGTGSHEVGVVGRIVILYRRHPERPSVPLRT